SLLPADTERLTVFTLDAARIFDLMDQAFAPLPAMPGSRTFSEELAEFEKTIGVSVRNELIPALGTEVAYSGTFQSAAVGPDIAPEGMKRPLSVFIFEVRNPDVVRKVITTVLTPNPDSQPPTPSDYKGAELYEMPSIMAV